MSTTPNRTRRARGPSSAVSRVYRIPAVLALLSLVGLSSALVGDGVFDVLSWLALGGVVATAVWALCFRRQRRLG